MSNSHLQFLAAEISGFLCGAWDLVHPGGWEGTQTLGQGPHCYNCIVPVNETGMGPNGLSDLNWDSGTGHRWGPCIPGQRNWQGLLTFLT